MTAPLAEQIETLLEPEAARQGVELVAVEVAGAVRQPLVRVLLDKPGGITLDDIVEANRWIAAILDDEDPVPSAYTLEVSSPGVDRPLRKIEDFERFAGSTASLKTAPIDGRGKFVGTIAGTDGDTVLLEVDGATVRIPISAVQKAKLKGEVDFSRKGVEETNEF